MSRITRKQILKAIGSDKLKLWNTNELPYVVECRSFAKFFEPIAAFNVKAIAEAYALECAKVNPQFTYRIVTIRVIIGETAA